MNDLTDRELVDRYLKRRDEPSFGHLYRRHSAALYGMAVRFCGNKIDAEDALQEMWKRACGSMSNFRWESTFRTWAVGILINCVREVGRNNGALREVPADSDREPTLEASEEVLSLEDAIARLPDGYRCVLLLHDVEGYTHEEIAEMLRIAVGTSKSQLHHARRAFRSLYLARTET